MKLNTYYTFKLFYVDIIEKYFTYNSFKTDKYIYTANLTKDAETIFNKNQFE